MTPHNIFHHNFKFRHPTTIGIVGPSQVGKSQFCIRLLQHLEDLMVNCPQRVIWAYGVKNSDQMDKIRQIKPDVEFVEGIPDSSQFSDPTKPCLIILDDLMSDIGKNPQIAKLFTMDSHHCRASVIAIIHNLFNQEKFSRTLALNTHYNIIFRSKRDRSQIARMNTQMFPGHPQFLQSAYDQATSRPYGYLVIDLHPATPESLSVRSGIFPDEVPVIFQPHKRS